MTDKYKVVVKLYSDSNPDLVEREIVEKKEIEPVNTDVMQ